MGALFILEGRVDLKVLDTPAGVEQKQYDSILVLYTVTPYWEWKDTVHKKDKNTW